MKKLSVIICCMMLVFACKKSESGPGEDEDPYKNSPSSLVPNELSSGIWFSGNVGAIAYFDQNGHNVGQELESGREYQFRNQNGQGRLQFSQYLGVRSSSTCTSETYTYREGTVKFEGDKFTFYPVKGTTKTIKKGCSSGNATTNHPVTKEELKPVVYRWEIRVVNGENCLYTFMEDDTDLSDPVFVYSFTN